MPYTLINNGDTGLSVRTTLNTLLNDANTGVFTGATGAAGTSGSSGSSGVVPSGATAGCFGITIDGNGSTITTGVKGYVEMPYSGTITSWSLFADQSGSIVIDVWKDTFANFPPTVADTIAGSEKPNLTGVQAKQDLDLTTWTTSVNRGDIIAFNVESATTVQRVNLIIDITKL